MVIYGCLKPQVYPKSEKQDAEIQDENKYAGLPQRPNKAQK